MYQYEITHVTLHIEQIMSPDRIEGSSTISNHVDGSRNYLDSLLELMNEVGILESATTISMLNLYI